MIIHQQDLHGRGAGAGFIGKMENTLVNGYIRMHELTDLQVALLSFEGEQILSDFKTRFFVTWFRIICVLLAGLVASSGHALTPLPDSRPAFFAGDWMGVGARDIFCFMRLRSDGTGTVLVSSASGDWLGASIGWRNQRQSIALIEVNPLPAEPARRLMPLSQLSLSSGVNKTIQLKLKEDSPVCELQLRAGVERRGAQAESLLDGPAGIRKSDGGK